MNKQPYAHAIRFFIAALLVFAGVVNCCAQVTAQASQSSKGITCSNQVPPVMPKSAIDKNIEGVVRVQATVYYGLVTDVNLLSGDPIFYSAVKDAMTQYKCAISSESTTVVQEFTFRIDRKTMQPVTVQLQDTKKELVQAALLAREEERKRITEERERILKEKKEQAQAALLAREEEKKRLTEERERILLERKEQAQVAAYQQEFERNRVIAEAEAAKRHTREEKERLLLVRRQSQEAALLRPLISSSDPRLSCQGNWETDPRFSPIANKISLTGVTDITFEMLSNQALPSAKELVAIASLGREFKNCMRQSQQYRLGNYSSEENAILDREDAAFLNASLDLYAQKISFGKYNNRVQAIANESKRSLSQLENQIKADKAAEAMAEMTRLEAQREYQARQDQQREYEQRRQLEFARQERQQQEARERASFEKAECIKKTEEGPACFWRCIDPHGKYIGQTIPGCVDSCEDRKRAAVAACNGVYLPPPPQQIIIQQGNNFDPFANANKCIQDGGPIFCPNRK